MSNLRAIPNNVSLWRRVDRWARSRTCRNPHFWNQITKWSDISAEQTDTCANSFSYIFAHKQYIWKFANNDNNASRSDYTPTVKCQISSNIIWIQRRRTIYIRDNNKKFNEWYISDLTFNAIAMTFDCNVKHVGYKIIFAFCYMYFLRLNRLVIPFSVMVIGYITIDRFVNTCYSPVLTFAAIFHSTRIVTISCAITM